MIFLRDKYKKKIVYYILFWQFMPQNSSFCYNIFFIRLEDDRLKAFIGPVYPALCDLMLLDLRPEVNTVRVCVRQTAGMQTEQERERRRKSERKTEKARERKRQTEQKRDRLTGRETDRERERQIDRQKDRQRKRETDRKADRARE